MQNKMIDRIAFELQADFGVEFFDYETSEEQLTLTPEQIEEFLEWHLDGMCPACRTYINEDEVICDSCFAKARQFPARADALLAAGQ